MKKSTLHLDGITISEDVKGGVPTGLWRIDLSPKISPSGKRARYQYASKTAAQTAARNFVKKLKINDHLSRLGDNGYTLNDVFDPFVSSEKIKVEAGRKRLASLRNDLNGLTHVLRHLGDHHVAKIDDEAVTYYQAKRKAEGVKPITINTELRKLRLMLNWCLAKRMIVQMPKINNMIESPVQTEVPSLPELILILNELPFRHRVLTRLMCETGLRVSEAMKLRWKQVDLIRKVIKIAETEVSTPKTAHSNREVMLGDGLVHDLTRLGQEHAHIFPGFRDPNKPMDNYRKALKTAVLKSGVQRYGEPIRFTPKFGRKAFTSYQWLRGTPIELIQKMVGHSPSSRVTMKNYLHMPSETERNAVLDLDVLASEAK